jgi:hypothetical protein
MSFVAMMTTDADTIVNPRWEQVEAAVGSLDARNMTLVILAPAAPKGPPNGDHHMGIGGGKDDRCVVYLTENNLHFWNLEDVAKSKSETRILMLVGGQEGDYREAQCSSTVLAR